MKTIIIEENIWSITTKKPIRRCVLTQDGIVFTRQLYNIKDTTYRNDTKDIIDLDKITLRIKLKDVKGMSITEIGEYFKNLSENYKPEKLLKKHVDQELPFFKSPTITEFNN